jgi:hypothetical protein
VSVEAVIALDYCSVSFMASPIACMRRVFGAAGLMLWSPYVLAQHRDANALRAFETIKTLIGSWQGAPREGKPHSVTYRFTANDSVIVETWTLGPTRESMTLYSVDGDRLIATHYCPQGNQPRLQWKPGSRIGQLRFELVGGSNLHARGALHQQAFWLTIHSPTSFTRSETYVPNGSPRAVIASTPEGEAITYTRSVEDGIRRN